MRNYSTAERPDSVGQHRQHRSAMNDGSTNKVLDLAEVTLVDVTVVRFLIHCENEGVELLHRPLYVREWMLRERAEGTPEPSNDD